jgi:hypothetical protein
MSICQKVSIALSCFRVDSASQECGDFQLLLKQRQCFFPEKWQRWWLFLSPQKFLFECVCRILEKKEVQSNIRTQRQVTDLVSFQIEHIGRYWARLSLFDMLLDAVICLQEGLLDHRVASLRGLVLNYRGFAVDRVTVLPQWFVLCLYAREDLLAVC